MWFLKRLLCYWLWAIGFWWVLVWSLYIFVLGVCRVFKVCVFMLFIAFGNILVLFFFSNACLHPFVRSPITSTLSLLKSPHWLLIGTHWGLTEVSWWRSTRGLWERRFDQWGVSRTLIIPELLSAPLEDEVISISLLAPLTLGSSPPRDGR